MIIFNTTFHLEDDILDDCLLFLKNIYIPQAINSGFLHSPRLALIHAQHEESGTSYSLQFGVKNTDTLNHWLSTEGQALQKELTARFGNKALGFITLLEEIDL
ncbi:MAG: DUF4286 family protein [Dysgonomonas sp.]